MSRLLIPIDIGSKACPVTLEILPDPLRIHDDVFLSQEKLRHRWVEQLRVIVDVEAVVGPVKVTLDVIGDSEFGRDQAL